jgi:hypothetical protein
MSTTLTVGDLLYEFTGKIAALHEFGVALPAVLSGQVPIPPGGARFDIHVEGNLAGPRLKASVAAIDYIEMRADGLSRLHVHARLTTADGANIAFFADGIAVPEANSPVLTLKENVTLFTNAPAYAWVNAIQVWAQGTANPALGEIRIKAYIA